MKILMALVCTLIVSGCATRLDGQPLDPAARNGVFYVERQPKDDRNLNNSIADELRKRGFQVTSGEASARPENTNYVVNYIDQWHWDIRMYLLELRIEIRDSSAALAGYGRSKQTSLAAMGKSHVDIINRALDQMLVP